MVVVCSLLGLSRGLAQEQPLDFEFETDSIPVTKGATFINFLLLENKSNRDISVKNLGPEENYPGLLLSPQSKYSLAPGEKKRLPLKFLANLDFMKMQSPNISYSLSYKIDQEQRTLKTSFAIQKEDTEQIGLYSLSRDHYINPSAGQSRVSLFVKNRGYSRRSIKLSPQASPQGLVLSPKDTEVSLEGGEKKLVEFKVDLQRRRQRYPDYNIAVTATDLTDNKEVATTYLNVKVLSNTKQLAPTAGPSSGKNFIEMTYNKSKRSFDYLQLKGNTEFRAGKDIQGRFNATGNYYLREDKYNFYDTWLELERKGSQIRLGNIHGNEYDYSVSGRGGKINTEIGSDKEIEVLALENNYNLFGNYFPQNKSSTIAGTQYKYGKSDQTHGKISYLFDHNPRLDINTQVANANSSFVLDSLHNFKVEAGLSQEKGVVNKDENFGVSAGLNYESELGHWDFRSYNSWASRHYAGLDRGTFDFNQTIGYRFSDRKRIFARYQNTQVNPGYLAVQNPDNFGGQAYNRDYYYSKQYLQTGIQLAIADWQFLFSPKFAAQKNRNNLNNDKLTAYRFYTKAGTSFGKHSIDLSAEYSYAKADSELNWFDSWKGRFSYRYQSFSINASTQINPHDVNDLNFHNSRRNKNFVNYNIYSAYNFEFFDNSLSGALSAGINYSELYENTNRHLNGNLEYKISQNWAATGRANYSNYESTGSTGYKGSNYQFRIGIKKYFTRATAPGNHAVDLQLFHDKNLNGTFDDGETALANQVVYLDDFVAITDKEGRVAFQNVSEGSYKLKIDKSRELHMARNPEIAVDRHKDLQIAMVKDNKLTGKLVEVKQKYDDLETDVRGISVYAKDKQSGEIYSTVVNQNNEFEFFLTDGRYDIYIKNDKYKFINASQNIQLNDADYPEPLIFKYKKKNRKIDVKKF